MIGYRQWFPELEYVPDAKEQRVLLRRALNRGLFMAWPFWGWVLFVIVAGIWTKSFIAALLPWPLLEAAVTAFLFSMLGSVGSVWLFRRNISKHLRYELNDRGIHVCLNIRMRNPD